MKLLKFLKSKIDFQKMQKSIEKNRSLWKIKIDFCMSDLSKKLKINLKSESLLTNLQHLNNCLKVAYKSPRLTFMLKHHVSHWELPRDYFSLYGVTETAHTATTISRLKIIMQKRSRTLLTHLKTLYLNSYLRILVDGVASVYRGIQRCFGTTLVYPVVV